MSEETDSSLPDAETCQILCEKFAEITETDTICAQIFLQERNWKIESALSDFYEGTVNEKSQNTERDRDRSINVNSSTENTTSDQTTKPCTLKFITWNSDGLDEKNILLRIRCICRTIKAEDADIVFLQEVIPKTLEEIVKRLPEYKCIPGNNVEYFIVTLVKKSTVSYVEHNIHHYPNSRMGRNLLRVEVKIGNIPVTLLNTHLESTGEASHERIEQLRIAFDKVSKIAANKTVILAGDFNLRDKELQCLGLPAEIEDVWIVCGSRKECAYTWDMTRNDNLTYNSGSRYKPRFRFDRLYLRKSSPAQVEPDYFGLIGLERLRPHTCFPSDHWGILSKFQCKT